MINEIYVSELQEKLKAQNSFLLDVRTQQEFDFANIGGTLIPINELETRIDELDKTKTYYCLCHHGMRSAMAAQILMANGFTEVFNISGGIDAYSDQVDGNIPKY